MTEYRIRRRRRLKTKESRQLRQTLSEAMDGCDLWTDTAAVEVGELPEFEVIVVDGEPRGIIADGAHFLSVRGALAYRPQGRYITVDMGAVRFVTNGADIMAPGIVDADPALAEGDLAWIRDERNKQPLAIGRCIMPGAEMGAASKGKAVASVHYIGDKLWKLE